MDDFDRTFKKQQRAVGCMIGVTYVIATMFSLVLLAGAIIGIMAAVRYLF